MNEKAFTDVVVTGAGDGGAAGVAVTEEMALMVVVIVDFLNLLFGWTDSAPGNDNNRNL